jgi:hypothetical protein
MCSEASGRADHYDRVLSIRLGWPSRWAANLRKVAAEDHRMRSMLAEQEPAMP